MLLGVFNTTSPNFPPGSGRPQPPDGHRLFLRGAIATVLTLGAAWGALLLLRIAASGSFVSISLQEVNAHGHAQIFGWVGLFAMGYAYYGLAALKRTRLAAPRLAVASFWLMAGGLAARSLFQPLVDFSPWCLLPALAGSLAEIAAVALCCGIVAATLRRSPRGLEAADGFVLAALAWFLIQAVYDAGYFAATALASDRGTLLRLVADWQAPLREMQIHGLAMLMILGISQQLLPRWYGMRQTRPNQSQRALVLINLALAGVIAGSILIRQAGHAWAGAWYLAAVVMAAVVIALVLSWGIWRPAPRQDRGLTYVRAAYLWLLVSLAMLAALPVYQFALLPWLAAESAAARIGFSHAYYGAIRHAITVGFVSQMIVAVSARLTAELRGARIDRQRVPWSPLVLINAGCAVRVAGQAATDFTPLAFPIIGPSGLVELAGLAVWGVHLWRLTGRPAGRLPARAACGGRAAPVRQARSRRGGEAEQRSALGAIDGLQPANRGNLRRVTDYPSPVTCGIFPLHRQRRIK